MSSDSSIGAVATIDRTEELEPIPESRSLLDRLNVRPGFLLSLSSRIGVWGLLCGVGAFVAPLFFSFPHMGLTGVVGGLGLLAGGLGIFSASALVLRETDGSKRRLRLGAVAVSSFGLVAAAHGVIWLWFMPWVRQSIMIGEWITTGALGFGIILVVLVVAGLLMDPGREADSEPEVI